MPRFIPVLIVGLLAGLPAQADQWDALREDPGISEGLVNFTIARHINNRCPDISARRFRAMGYVNDLISDATSLGYTRSEIRSYVFNETEQDRVREIADERLALRDASPTQMAGYCTVGREEMAAGSTIGSLLR